MTPFWHIDPVQTAQQLPWSNYPQSDDRQRRYLPVGSGQGALGFEAFSTPIPTVGLSPKPTKIFSTATPLKITSHTTLFRNCVHLEWLVGVAVVVDDLAAPRIVGRAASKRAIELISVMMGRAGAGAAESVCQKASLAPIASLLLAWPALGAASSDS
jgi:hypothetical protein